MSPVLKAGDTVYCLVVPDNIDVRSKTEEHVFVGILCGTLGGKVLVVDNKNQTGVFDPRRVYRTEKGGLFAYWMLKFFGHAI